MFLMFPPAPHHTPLAHPHLATCRYDFYFDQPHQDRFGRQYDGKSHVFYRGDSSDIWKAKRRGLLAALAPGGGDGDGGGEGGRPGEERYGDWVAAQGDGEMRHRATAAVRKLMQVSGGGRSLGGGEREGWEAGAGAGMGAGAVAEAQEVLARVEFGAMRAWP